MRFPLTIAFLFLILNSCNRDGDMNNPRENNFGTVTMKIDGETINLKAFHKAHDDGNEISFQAFSCEDEISLAIVLISEIGDNDISRGQLKFNIKDCLITSGADWYSIEGTSSITEIGNQLKGTFECEAFDTPTGAHYCTVTEGFFTIELNYD